tara:strand:- start:595 stop:864 length:270 start_codon:yes stop_codon:yes gene_type:complete
VRAWCERRGNWGIISHRSDQIAREGRRVCSRGIDKGRNMVERCVGWLRRNRRLRTRYEMLASHYLAMIKLEFISPYLRLLEPPDTTETA